MQPQGYNPDSYGQLRAVPPAPATAPTPVIAPGAGSPVRPVPSDNVARGFVLYMGIDEETAAAAGTSIAKLAQEIRAYAQSAGLRCRKLRRRRRRAGQRPGFRARRRPLDLR